MDTNIMELQQRYGERARDLFDRVCWASQLHKHVNLLIGKSSTLPLLRERYPQAKAAAVERRKQQPIRLDQIVGTVGNMHFDRGFRPLSRAYKARWMSVAMAMFAHPAELPPIQVIEINDEYFVIDGHHRVSVARALSHLYIDADVKIWRFGGQVRWTPEISFSQRSYAF